MNDNNPDQSCLECGALPLDGYAALERAWRYEGEVNGAIRYRCDACLRKPEHDFCCAKATAISCVCFKSWSCPDHGSHHVGSHD